MSRAAKSDFDYRQFKVPTLVEWPTWKRYEPGWYRTLINGSVVEIKNMHGMSVLYSGSGDHVVVRVGVKNDEYGSGGRDVTWTHNITAAKEWVAQNYDKVRRLDE